MAAVTTPPVTGPYANISTTAASFTGCGPCSYLQILDPAIGQWYPTISNNISALRTTQLYIDQNYNTTSTSVDCNSDALSQYPPPDTRYAYNPTYGLDNECNLLATWSALDRYFGPGTLTSLPWYQVTATLSASLNEYLYLGPFIFASGEVSTTGTNGQPTCLTDTIITNSERIGHYTDQILTTTIIGSLGWPVTSTLLPQLSNYVEGYDAIFEQCTLIYPGGSPVALTPAKEIILPAITIPASPTSATRPPVTSNTAAIPASTTSSSRIPEPTTTQESERPETQRTTTSRPATDDGENDTPSNTQPTIVLPTQPSNRPSQPSDDDAPDEPTSRGSTAQVPSSANDPPETSAPSRPSNENPPAAPTSQGNTNQPPSSAAEPVEPSSPPQPSDEGTPAAPTSQRSTAAVPSSAAGTVQISNPPPQSSNENSPPAPSSQGNTNQPPSSAAEPVQTSDSPPQSSNENSPPAPSSEGNTNQPPSSAAKPVETSSPSQPSDESAPNAPSSQGSAAQPPSSAIEPAGTSSPPRTSAANSPDDSPSEGGAEEPPRSSQSSQVIIPVGPAATQTQSNAETSLDVEIVPVATPEASNGAVTTSRATSIQGVGSIGTVSGDSDAYAIGSATTLTAGGPAATISGTVFSALPSGSGVAAASEPADPFASFIASGVSGQSIGVASDDSDEDGYILGNGATLAAGQDAAVVSGTTFTALATGGEVVAIANGQSTTLTTLPGASSSPVIPIVAVQGGEQGFVLEDGSTVTAGGSAVSVSGTTYSALPSGSGIVAIADGSTSTLAKPTLAAGSGSGSGSGSANAFVVGGSVTISQGGEAATVDGTTYSVRPSGSGVVAIADGSTSTLAEPTAVEVEDTPGAYAVGDSNTISVGGSALTISGTTYSALPSGSGVVAVADGQTTTLDAGTGTSPSSAADAYVIGGSSTVSAGGSAITISGSTYSALPSGSGVIVVADGETTTIAKTALEQPDTTPTNTYIIAGSATISAGGAATAISGTTYSALPSGAGVVVVADGESSTVGPDGKTEPTSTGSADGGDVASFEGSASLSGKQLGGMACWAAAAAMVVVLV